VRIKSARTIIKVPIASGNSASRYSKDDGEEPPVACCCVSVNEFKIASVLELARK
jgi:hypothetical protein